MARYRGSPGYIDFGREFDLAHSRRMDRERLALSLRAEQRSIADQIYSRQRQERDDQIQLYEMRIKNDIRQAEGLSVAQKEIFFDRKSKEYESIQDPLIREMTLGTIRGTVLDPNKVLRDKFNKAYPKRPPTDTSGMTDQQASIALADDIDYEDFRVNELRKMDGLPPLPTDKFRLLDGDKVYYKDGDISRVVPLKTFNVEEIISKTGSTDTLGDALSKGFVRSQKKGETFGVNGKRQYVYEDTNIKNGKKTLSFVDAGYYSGGGPGAGGEGDVGSFAGLDKVETRNLKSYLATWMISEATDIDDYEGSDKAILGDVKMLEGLMDEAGSDMMQRKQIVSDFFEKRKFKGSGLAFTVVDKAKFKKKGFFGRLFGPNVEYNEGSKYGVLAVVPGTRYKGHTKDEQPFEAILGSDGRVYDLDFEYHGVRFNTEDGQPDDKAFMEWVLGSTKEDLEGGPTQVPKKITEGKSLTLGDVNRYMAQPWMKMWYGLDSMTWAVVDAFKSIGDPVDPKAVQDALVARSNEWNQGNLKDAFDVMVELGMEVGKAVKNIEKWPIPFTKGLGD